MSSRASGKDNLFVFAAQPQLYGSGESVSSCEPNPPGAQNLAFNLGKRWNCDAPRNTTRHAPSLPVTAFNCSPSLPQLCPYSCATVAALTHQIPLRYGRAPQIKKTRLSPCPTRFFLLSERLVLWCKICVFLRASPNRNSRSAVSVSIGAK